MTRTTIMASVARMVRSLQQRCVSTCERGQSTAEYALLLLGAATIAMLVVSWAAGTGKIEQLFNAVIDSVIGRV